VMSRRAAASHTLFRRRRQLPELNSHVGRLKAQAERQAVNAVIQGTAADVMKAAMVAVDGRLRQLQIAQARSACGMFRCECVLQVQ
jgi:DNA polymerase-1